MNTPFSENIQNKISHPGKLVAQKNNTMAKIALKYRIGREQVAELTQLYASFIANTEADTEHDVLLLSLMQDMYAKMQQITKAEAVNCTLKMTDTEAIAFFQQWSTCDISAWKYANAIVKKILLAIDKKARQYSRVA
jgi:hypothetical protein